MRRRWAAIAGLAAVTTACSGAQAIDPGAIRLDDTTPRASGAVDNVTWLLASEPRSLDPDRKGGTNEGTVTANICDRLFQLQPDLSPKPHLVARFDYPDPRTLVLTLREGVRFHNGSTMTADDVVWSLRRHAEPSRQQADEFGNVTAIEATGPLTVTVRFSKPDSMFQQALAGDAGVVYDREYVEPLGKDYGTPSSGDGCSGPYRLARWRSGTDLVIERVDDYWDPAVRPLVRTVTFRWADDSTVVNNLTTGAADGTYLKSPTPAVPLTRNSDISVFYGPTTAVWSLIPTARGAMADTRVRRALSLAMDRSGIAKAGFTGLAQPWKAPVGSGSWSYQRERFAAAYDRLGGAPASPGDADLAEAARLVREAGSPAKPIVVASDGSQARSVVANAVVDAARRIGLTAEIRTMSKQQFSAMYTDEAARADIDLSPEPWYITKSDPIGFYKNAATDAPNNWVGYSSPDYDRLMTEALRALDDGERARLAIELQDRFTADAVWIPLVQVPNVLVLNRKLTGPPASMAFVSYPWAAHLGASRTED
ncbi:ABC transporter substrate-binding protein [Amycolatopsis suaedae]|uniref:ABC transporter substrate-binding protein n=1 Tax=Amycolatopsis suaedae TaxID=2510978 RepID=A0A4Q7J2L4_9PSEU|nr:ABC transporter substrate-binding protein [Amycolatopsis suaedae]RZQ60832.1 ABC transporter substrate-binding protein [Amycolatopsis suaedae]